MQNAREEWRVFENTHEAIIPPDRWELAQYALYVRRRTDSTGTANPLTGKLVCAECGALMNNRRSKAGKTGRRSDDFYDCPTFSHGNGCCGHYISTENVRELVLQAIRSVGRYAIGNEIEFAEKVREVSALRHADEIRGKLQEAEKARKRIDELDAIIRTLYERYALGKIPESRFEALAAGYEKEQSDLRSLLAEAEAELVSYQNAWAQYEKKMDEALIAQGEDVSNLYLRYVLASRIFESTVPPNRKDRRLEDATGLMVVMSDYNITDAASYAEAVRRANSKFYDLRSRHKENAELSSAIGARIHAYEDRKKYQRYYNAWSKLSGSKASAYEREHKFELHKYRQADEALNRWEADGERIDCKGWQTAMKHLNKERFALDYELRGQKEDIRRLEVVKREFIRERKRSQMGRDER